MLNRTIVCHISNFSECIFIIISYDQYHFVYVVSSMAIAHFFGFGCGKPILTVFNHVYCSFGSTPLTVVKILHSVINIRLTKFIKKGTINKTMSIFVLVNTGQKICRILQFLKGSDI